MYRKILQVVFYLVIFTNASAQPTVDSSMVSVSGKAYNKTNPSTRLEDLMIINLTTGQGIFGKADGTFSIFIHKSDSVLVASTGYEYTGISFKDSVMKPSYFLDVPLVALNVKLKEVTIFSPRNLETIYKDIEKLGYNKRDFQIGGVEALQSPITFLYQQFSIREQLKRHNAERINIVKRKELLKELLSTYVTYDIINLDDREFDDFVDFCNVSEAFMKKATQYEFCVFIKQKFEVYKMMMAKKR